VAYFFIGEDELLIGLRFAGVDGEAVRDAQTALSAFHQVAVPQSPYKVLILTEQVSLWLGAELTAWQLSGSYPLVVEIPAFSGHLKSAKSLVTSIREAIGVQV
jgi:vacuolar-type H+-ATPase subunit F/Vma7